ncbi:hypothetical protein CspeluHIS016_0701040 [Cutaneotrichosporon spelunceum]|uniref:Uncharacterized protein n=1 Tax=Cutaneotrichosporon spelunceum TaxID=1672016 RepID=A0AAD3TYX6_9TREE|nr:hypothetical protein CspeluHIS016_0701040 [Cutaneotrichosporon spelunceum]
MPVIDRRPSMPVPSPLSRATSKANLGRPRLANVNSGSGSCEGESDGEGGEGLNRNPLRIDTHASIAPVYPLIIGRRRTQYIRLPVLVQPLLNPRGSWLSPEDVATPWLSLFYDLAVGAILSAFNGSHQLQSAENMPSYFAYYVIIVSLWTTQLHYDMRYEGDDVVHRVFKGLHLALFVYIGAASGGWDLSRITVPQLGTVSGADSVAAAQAGGSFLTVAIAIALNHSLLCMQYIMVVVVGRKAGRPTASPALSAASLSVTCSFVIVAAAIPARTDGLAAAKIVFMYTSVLIDMGSILFQVLWGVQVPVRWHRVAERYGSLTLIILGQGFSQLTTVFQNSLTGLGARDSTTYAQVFLAIGIMYNLWSLLFSNFRQEVPVDAGRTWLYEIIHFPLHFSMLLLLIAVVNTITINSFAYSIVDAGNLFVTMLTYIKADMPVTSPEVEQLAIELNRLKTYPEFEQQYVLLQGMENGTIAGDMELEAYTYLAQLLYSACQKSSIVITSDAGAMLTALFQIDQNATAPGFDIVDARAQAASLGVDALTSIIGSALKGTMWLYPTAGTTLVLCALRSMTRYHFLGATHWVVHGLQLGVGSALGLLGLLGIGSDAVTLNWYDKLNVYRPLYKVVLHRVALVVVFVAYSLVVIGCSMWNQVFERCEWKTCWRRRKRERVEDEAL